MLKGGKNGCFLGLFLLTLVVTLSFVELHRAFTKASVLAHFNIVKPICLKTDTSDFLIAAIMFLW
jgi:hypothetical protein